MRLHRVLLRNYRGIGYFELRLADTGVWIVEGPNESGKTSVAQAIDLALEHLDSSSRGAVRGAKPVHRDVATEVELELTTGPYRVDFRKRWHRSPATTLTVHAPRAENVTGREAHERMRAILDETMDVGLWKALQVQQGLAGEQAAVSASRSLSAALDRAAADGGFDEDSATLWDRVVEERARYWTPTGKPSAERTRLREQIEEAGRTAERVRTEMAELDDAAERHRALVQRQSGLASDRSTAVRRLHELEEAVHEVEASRAEVTAADEAAQHAGAAHAAATRALDVRRDLTTDAAEAAEALAATEAALVPARTGSGEAERRRDDVRSRVMTAREATRAAETAEDDAKRAVEWHRLRAEAVRLDRDVAELDEAEARGREAAAVLAASVVDVEQVTLLEQYWSEVVASDAAVRVSAATVEVEALADLQITLGGHAVRLPAGHRERRAAGDGLQLELPGLLRVTVADGAEAARIAGDAGEARRRFEAAAIRLGLEPATALADARAKAAERASAARIAEDVRAQIRRLLDGATAADLRERRQATAAQLAGHSAPDATDEPGAARRDLAVRTEAVSAARREQRSVEELIQAAEDEVHTRARDQAIAESARLFAAQVSERAATELEKAAAGEPLAALEQAEQRAQQARAAAETVASRRRAALDALDPDGSALLADNQRRVVERFDHEQGEVRDELARTSGYLDARGGDALQERLDEALTERERLVSRQRGLERRADAAQLLHATLGTRRDEVRTAIARPLKAKIESFARVAFDGDVTVRLADDLTIDSRTVDGVTTEWADLSTGTKEQFGVIMRLACAAIVADGDDVVPVILDDVLGHSDGERIARLDALLSRAGTRGQIIVLTCSPRRFESVGGAVVLHMADLLRAPGTAAPQRPATAAAGSADASSLILACLGIATEPLSRAQVLELTGLASDEWPRAIDALVEDGAVLRSGEKRGTRYRLSS